MTKKEIAEKIGDAPIGVEPDRTDPQYKKFGGRPCRMVAVYPSYHTDCEAALRVLKWLNNKAQSYCAFGLFSTKDIREDFGPWFISYSEYYDGCFVDVLQRFEAPTAPLAIIAAFEWFIKEQAK